LASFYPGLGITDKARTIGLTGTVPHAPVTIGGANNNMTEHQRDGGDNKPERRAVGESLSVTGKEQAADQDQVKKVQETRRKLKDQGIMFTTASRTFGGLAIDGLDDPKKTPDASSEAPTGTGFSPETARTKAQSFNQFLYSGMSGGDGEKAVDMLAKLKPDEIKAVRESYNQEFGNGDPDKFFKDVHARLRETDAQAIDKLAKPAGSQVETLDAKTKKAADLLLHFAQTESALRDASANGHTDFLDGKTTVSLAHQDIVKSLNYNKQELEGLTPDQAKKLIDALNKEMPANGPKFAEAEVNGVKHLQLTFPAQPFKTDDRPKGSSLPVEIADFGPLGLLGAPTFPLTERSTTRDHYGSRRD
jgi:hypothetical protein